MPAPPIIFEATATCRQRFEQCLLITSLMRDEWAENRLADFNLWAAGVGASASRQASLDERLVFKPHVRDVIANLLRMLNTFMGQCQEYGGEYREQYTTPALPDKCADEAIRGRTKSDALSLKNSVQRSFSPWSDASSSTSDSGIDARSVSSNPALSEAMRNTETILDQLSRLAVTIRKSGTHARLQKADRCFDLNGHEDLRNHLIAVLLSQPAKDGNPPMQRDPSTLNQVQQRLINANLRRANRFRYAQRHSMKLGPGPMLPLPEKDTIDQHNETFVDRIALANRSPILVDATPSTQQRARDVKRLWNLPAAAGATSTTASAVEGSIVVPQTITPSKPAMTQVSSTGSKLVYPRPPRMKQGLHTFKCPCCCQSFPRMFSEGERWRKHLKEDLCPYTCVLDDCPKPETLYATRETWMSHMSQEHVTFRYWMCFACNDPVQFDHEGHFVSHIEGQHKNTISADQIPMLTSACLRSAPLGIISCPLCKWAEEQEGDMDPGVVLDHVAEHVHSFSLRALPWAPDDKEEDQKQISECAEKVNEWFTRWPTSENGTKYWPHRSMEEHAQHTEDYFELNDYFASSSGSQSNKPDDSVISDERDLGGLPGEGPLKYVDSQEDDSDEQITNSPALAEAADKYKIDVKEDKREKIFRWLSPIGLYDSHDAAREKHEEETGRWFLRCSGFIQWKTKSYQFLWLYGIPGCGKTILCSTIIEDVKQYDIDRNKDGFAHFYFDFADHRKQTVTNFLCSVIVQLSCQRPTIPEEVEALYNDHNRSLHQPSVDSLCSTFSSLVSSLRRTYLVIDALDECSDQPQLLKTLEKLCRSKINILVTSRIDRDIKSALEPYLSGSICINGDPVKADVRLHVRKRLAKDPDLNKWPPNIKEEIESALVDGANGMFRWVACQLEALKKCIKLVGVRNMLKKLPKTLYETYDRVLAKIPSEHCKEAYAALQWLAFSARPMSLQEVADAVVIEPGASTLSPDDRLYQPEDILKICSSLVSISESGQELRLAHYSVKEYITSEEIRAGPLSRFSVSEVSANCLLGKVCLTYLLSFSKPEPLSHHVLQEYPLLNYAARHWFAHARFVPENSDPLLEDLSLKLFNSGESSALRNWLWIYDPEDSSARRHSQREQRDIPHPLYYAAYLGLLGTTKKLLKNRANWNAQSGRHGNALQAAAYGGHEAVVRLLIERGLDVNIKGGQHGTALQAAAERGNEVMVLLLLEKGAEVNANVKDGHFGTAIQAAAYEGHKSVVLVLLEHGADVNASSGRYGNALQAAAYEGHHEVVQLLLDQGANPRASDGYFGTALQAAAYEGHLKVVHILLEKGADVNATGGRYGSALQAAAYGRHEGVMKLLLEWKAHFEEVLQGAALEGRMEVVRLLTQMKNEQSGELALPAHPQSQPTQSQTKPIRPQIRLEKRRE